MTDDSLESRPVEYYIHHNDVHEIVSREGSGTTSGSNSLALGRIVHGDNSLAHPRPRHEKVKDEPIGGGDSIVNNRSAAKRPLEADEVDPGLSCAMAETGTASTSASFTIKVAKRQKVTPANTTVTTTTTIISTTSPKKQVNNENWDLMYQRLLHYKERYGHTFVPKRWKEDPQLGTWCETQRVQKKKMEKAMEGNGGEGVATPNRRIGTRMGPERLAKLEAVGFAWTAKTLKNKPQYCPAAAADGDFNDDNNNNATSSVGSTCTSNNNDIGASEDPTANNRSSPYNTAPTATNDGEGSSDHGHKMTPAIADDAQAKATARSRLNDEQWEDFYERLKIYKEKFGNCLVPRKFEADPKLGAWVETQRALWNRDFKQQRQNEQQETTQSPPLRSPGNASIVQVHIDADNASATPAIAEKEHGETTLTTYASASASAKSPVLPAPGASTADGQLMDTTTGRLPARRLTQMRKDRLDALGFVWNLRNKRIEDHWDGMFQQLVEYKSEHGDCLVPSRYEENNKLGKWVETQRYEYTKLQRANVGAAESNSGKTGDTCDGEGELNTSDAAAATIVSCASAAAMPSNSDTARPTNPRLTEERIRRLESIGFEWKVKNKMKRYYDRKWDEMFESLKTFKEEHGHCLVPKRYPADLKLGQWVHTQRIQHRKFVAGTAKNGGDASEFVASGEIKKEDEVSYRLTEERRKRLQEIGFIWNAKEGEKSVGGDSGKVPRNSYDNQWDIMFQRLVKFRNQFGHCLVPKRYSADPQLGTWCDTQRVQKKRHEKRLAEMSGLLPGEQMNEEGNARAPKPVVGRLTDERIRKLESIGFTWSLRDDWQKHYEELREFKNINGHVNVPARFTQNRRLGIWVSSQRQQYKIRNASQDSSKPKRSTPLTDERIKLLNELGFIWALRSRESPVSMYAGARNSNNGSLETLTTAAAYATGVDPEGSIVQETLQRAGV